MSVRDGYREYTHVQMFATARDAYRDLDALNGDPSRAASWIRERQLAAFVLALLGRIDELTRPVEVAP